MILRINEPIIIIIFYNGKIIHISVSFNHTMIGKYIYINQFTHREQNTKY